LLLTQILMAAFLQAENLSKTYGDKVLFREISFHVNRGDKIALVASNGSGKSSLLHLLAGGESPEGEGSIKFMKDVRIGYLEQEPVLDPLLTVMDQLRMANRRVWQALKAYNRAAAGSDKKKLEKAINDMDHLDGWNYDNKVTRILTLLDLVFPNKKIGSLSGGERKKVAVAGMLLQDADFLILDEPTNHLDLEVIEYLEEYLRTSSKTILMVTHDRYFLDRVCNHIFELDNGRLFTYKGNYSFFLEKREERIANNAAETDKARNLYRRELEWIRSTPCARTGKSKSRLGSFKQLQETAAVRQQEKKMTIDPGVARLGGKIIHCKDLFFSYGDKCLLKNFTYNFSRYEKIGIIGGNGAGKSTFLKLIAGELTPVGGTLQTGETVRFGFYRQEGMSFNPQDTVFDVVHNIAETVLMADGKRVPLNTFLNHFLFPPHTHQIKMEKLSGGEKRRLYLLTILMKNPNFLILDEPTNDLDILTLNVLEEYLEDFKGCLLIVSHDRYFLDKLADHLFVFEGDGIVRDYPGKTSEYYRLKKTAGSTVQNSGTSVKKRTDGTANGPGPVPEGKKLTYRQRKQMEALEETIQELDREKTDLEKTLSEPGRSLEEITQASVRMGEILSKQEQNWAELLDLEGQSEG
jgi:ABC transport system ATP-binding/permease protein